MHQLFFLNNFSVLGLVCWHTQNTLPSVSVGVIHGGPPTVYSGVRAVETPCQRAPAHLQVESSAGWVRPAFAVGGPTQVIIKLWQTSAESLVVSQHCVAWLCAFNGLTSKFEFQLVLGQNNAYCTTLNLPSSPPLDILTCFTSFS